MPDHQSLIGQTVSHYRILGNLGGGGMGVVYKAEDTKLGRHVALKFLPEDLARDPRALERLKREARSASALNHPNICTIHDIDEWEGGVFIVMELLEGETLKQRFETGPLRPAEVAGLAAQISDALAAAHKLGIIHRDIKPANIFLVRHGAEERAKLLDFGLAKQNAEAQVDATSLTASGAIMGTVHYMSPEQLRGEPAEARSDIWALGTVLYEMATGKQPFAETQTLRLVHAIQSEEPLPPRKLNPRISPALERVIRKAMDKIPSRRYESAAALAAELRALPEAQLGRPSALRNAWGGRRGVVAGLAGALVLAVLIDRFFIPGPRVVQPPAGKVMLAVLPFENLSGDSHDDYFADGLTEEMIAQLGELEPARLGVIARTSAMLYKNTQKDITQIGRELKVGYVLEGSVRLAGERVRVTAQLIQVSDQTHLWAESFDRTVKDIFEVQSGISERVTQSLALKLLPEQQARFAGAASVDPEAHRAYLLGRYELSKGTREGIEKAISYYQEAIAKDPRDAVAYAALSQAYRAGSTYYSAPLDVMPKAKDAALKSLELDDTLADAHVSLGHIALAYDWDWPKAESEFRRALELNPSLSEAQMGYATYLATLGRFDESLSYVRRAYELDPISSGTRPVALWIYLFSGRSPDTVQQCQKLLDLDPHSGLAYAIMAAAFVQMGKTKEATAAAERPEVASDNPTVLATAAGALATAGDRKESNRLLNAALAESPSRFVCRFTVAAVYTQLGEKGKALDSLQQAFLQRSD